MFVGLHNLANIFVVIYQYDYILIFIITKNKENKNFKITNVLQKYFTLTNKIENLREYNNNLVILINHAALLNTHSLSLYGREQCEHS